MLRRLGIEHERLRAETGLAFVVRRCTVDYLLPARLDDDLVSRDPAHRGSAAPRCELEQDVLRGDDAPRPRLPLRVACARPQRSARSACRPSCGRRILLASEAV